MIAQVDSDLQANFKVGYTDVDALLQLANADGAGLRMAALARSVSRSPSAMTRLVDKLEDRGLVSRRRHSPTDVQVTIAEGGMDLLAEAAPRIIDQVERRFWSRLTPTERDSLHAICRKLLDEDPPGC